MSRQASVNKLFLLLGAWAVSALMIYGQELSTPLSPSLSSGLNSNVAPTTSQEIEPGANNLLTPEERVLPYDAIGASIVATSMSPSITQFYLLLLSRSPYQIDSTLKDATFLTGIPQVIAANITDVITRKPQKVGQTIPTLSFGVASALSTALQGKLTPGASGDLSKATAPQSYWRAGGSMAALAAINSLQAPTETTQQQPGQSSDLSQTTIKDSIKSNGLVLKKKDKDAVHGVGSNVQAQSTDKTADYSRSPLEAPAYGDQGLTTVADSPFEGLDQRSFLNPDVTLASPLRFLSTRREKIPSREKMLAASQSGQEFSIRSRTGRQSTNRSMKDREMSPDQSRLTKLSPGREAAKPKWHNPILQQWESGANPNQQ
ncbi:hypothetical protein [Alloacidobacterium sp.]|uniref:hypothetical protein n=1 Tax=Alloacidobacterium sp. TaxID=2951999 RepID=UPI002D280FC7|nr:hypothetical protein [Alloacidobacterium sp.]HYK34995.1 hypothetical protein [Alloacidobacterium sp.]